MATKKKATTKANGRPTRYRADFHPFAVEYMARTGLIDTQMAEAFGIAESTFHKWKQAHPLFAKAIAKGKEEPDALVEASLFQRANGYSHEEAHVMQYQGEPVVVEAIKHYPPDVVACIFWLKNRRPDRWRDKQEVLNTYDDSVKELAKAIREI